MIEKTLELARRNGIRQAQLEAMAKLPQGRISKWKGGKGEPSVTEGLALARILGVPLDFLADADQDRIPVDDDDVLILRLVHAMNLPTDEIIRRIGQGGKQVVGMEHVSSRIVHPPAKPGREKTG